MGTLSEVNKITEVTMAEREETTTGWAPNDGGPEKGSTPDRFEAEKSWADEANTGETWLEDTKTVDIRPRVDMQGVKHREERDLHDWEMNITEKVNKDKVDNTKTPKTIKKSERILN